MDVIFHVVGIRISSFTLKDTGENKTYARVYVSYNEDKDTVGLACDRWSVKPEVLANLNVGDTVIPLYNKYGRVADIQIVNLDNSIEE